MENTIFHSSQGLTIRRNKKNGFVVCRLHYTADPDKCSEEWKREAQYGMSPAKFSREYEIDYGATLGEKVFPEISSHHYQIVVPEEEIPTFPDGQVFYGGFDFGQRNPSSFHVYTVWEGCIWAVWELFEPASNIMDYTTKMKACPYYEGIKYIAADPHIADLRQYGRDGNGSSILQQFNEYGVKKLMLAPNNELNWLAMMRNYWANPMEPLFKISSGCPNMIREFKGAIFSGQKDKLNLTMNFKETIADVNNHSLDDCKYFMLASPHILNAGADRRLLEVSAKKAGLVSKWSNWNTPTRKYSNEFYGR